MTDTPSFHGAKVALFIGDALVCILRDDISGIPFPGHWDFPGGGRELGETPYETAARETFEELGLDLQRAEILWQLETHSAHLNAQVHFFVAQLPLGAEAGIRFGDEGQCWRLMTVPEVLALPDLVPSLRERLSRFLSETDWQPGRSILSNR